MKNDDESKSKKRLLINVDLSDEPELYEKMKQKKKETGVSATFIIKKSLREWVNS